MDTRGRYRTTEPGTSVEAIALRDGRWIIVYNDLESGRHSLAVSMSDDEGATWKWTRHLDRMEKHRYHYPSVIQARDGSVHVTYSLFAPSESGKKRSPSSMCAFSRIG